MLDNVIDIINYYAVQSNKDSNLRHRPGHGGLMGFQDALYEMRAPPTPARAPSSCRRGLGSLSPYYALPGVTELSKERGTYSTFRWACQGSSGIPAPTPRKLLARGG